MANKARIAKLIQRRGDPPTQVNKSIAYSPGGSTVISGLLVEGTPYKDTVYIHRYVQPFFMEQDRIILSYSRRLQAAGGTEFFEGTDEQIADQCLHCLERTGLRQEAVEPMHEQRFIALVARGQVLGHDWRTELNFGAAHAVLGNLGDAAAHLGEARRDHDASLARRGPFSSDAAFRSTLDAYEAMLAAPGDLAAAIRGQARRHAAALGFTTAPAETVVPLRPA